MAFYGDPEALDRLARQVRHRGDEVRERAGRARMAASAVRWQSVARERFIVEVDSRARHLERAAALLDEAADRLDEQALALRKALAEICAAQAAVLDWVTDAKAQVESAAIRGLTRAVAAGVRLAPSAVPGPVGLRLPELPPPGDRSWVEVADALRRDGIRL